MKTLKISIMTLGLTASLFSLASCSADDDKYANIHPTALVTVYPSATDGFTMQLDDATTLVPTNMKASPFGDKQVRALVNYNDEEQTNGSIRNVRINWIDSIRTKMPVPTTDNDDKTFGNDPIEIVRDWVTVAEDGYLTLRIRTLWGGSKTHTLNLVSGANKDNIYELTLRHDANGDVAGHWGDALIAFNLNKLYPNAEKDVKIKLNWTSFSGPKSIEFPLTMHKDLIYTSTERAQFGKCVE